MFKLFVTPKNKPLYTTQKKLALIKKINVSRYSSNYKKKVNYFLIHLLTTKFSKKRG